MDGKRPDRAVQAKGFNSCGLELSPASECCGRLCGDVLTFKCGLKTAHSIITNCGACNLNGLGFEQAIFGLTNILISDSMSIAPITLAKT